MTAPLAARLAGLAWQVDREGLILGASSAAAAFAARGSLPDACDPVSAEKLRTAIERASDGEPVAAWEVNVSAGANVRTLLCALSPVEGDVLITASDVTAYVNLAGSGGIDSERAARDGAAIAAVLADDAHRAEARSYEHVMRLHDDVLQPLYAVHLRLLQANDGHADVVAAILRAVKELVATTTPFALAEGHVWEALRELASRHGGGVVGRGPMLDPWNQVLLYRTVERLLPLLGAGASITATVDGVEVVAAAGTPRLTPAVVAAEAHRIAVLGGALEERGGGRYVIRVAPTSS